MRILITGSNGMLGSDLVTELDSSYEVSGLGFRENRHPKIPYCQVDISDRPALLRAIRSAKPGIIIHTAAFVDADACESDPKRAFLMNAKATEFVAEASDELGATLFFMSSDYIFDGTKPSPYAEGDPPNPLNVYGHSKVAAEQFLKTRCRSAWILRVSWLFGADGKNFFETILKMALKGEKLRVVDDQKGAPTYTKDLAKAIRALIEKGNRAKGCHTYHLANSGETTWFKATKKMFERAHLDVDLQPITSKELNRLAKRPLNSVFDTTRIQKDFGVRLRSWEEALDEFWSESLEKKCQSLRVQP